MIALNAAFYRALTTHESKIMKISHVPSDYTVEQIVAYLRYIKFFADSPPANDVNPTKVLEAFEPSLENLARLKHCHLIAFPFENLAMH